VLLRQEKSQRVNARWLFLWCFNVCYWQNIRGKKMKIVADENMPFVEALFGDLPIDEEVEIVRINGRKLSAAMLHDAQVLLVRSVTKVNRALIEHSKDLIFVGSATIGTDHVDTDYLASRNIAFSNAPGCNATGVGEYAFIASLELAQREQIDLKNKVVGIVGAGNTGMAAAKCFNAFGMQVVLCDPFKTQAECEFPLVALDVLMAQVDIISLHVPLTKTGPHKTWYLFDETRLNALKADAWLFNCCRGEVIDNRALIQFKAQRTDVKLVLDVWEGEPNPMPDLVPLADFTTPHIAGYSLEGKARGTFMLYQALSEQLTLPIRHSLEALLPVHFAHQVMLNAHSWPMRLQLSEQGALIKSLEVQSQLLSLARLVYDLRDDDQKFRKHCFEPQGFDLLRKNHTHRREFSALSLASAGGCEVNWLSRLGFSGVGR
jgi:erythronate-4-phosphate dehydrogenase